MQTIDTMILRFSGDKVELKNQLKEWCEKSNKSMNGTVIALIQELLEANKQ